MRGIVLRRFYLRLNVSVGLGSGVDSTGSILHCGEQSVGWANECNGQPNVIRQMVVVVGLVCKAHRSYNGPLALRARAPSQCSTYGHADAFFPVPMLGTLMFATLRSI